MMNAGLKTRVIKFIVRVCKISRLRRGQLPTRSLCGFSTRDAVKTRSSDSGRFHFRIVREVAECEYKVRETQFIVDVSLPPITSCLTKMLLGIQSGYTVFTRATATRCSCRDCRRP